MWAMLIDSQVKMVLKPDKARSQSNCGRIVRVKRKGVVVSCSTPFAAEGRQLMIAEHWSAKPTPPISGSVWE